MSANEQAFPSGQIHSGGPYHIGLTKREYIAVMAMQGHISADQANTRSAEAIAQWSVACADALLRQLEVVK